MGTAAAPSLEDTARKKARRERMQARKAPRRGQQKSSVPATRPPKHGKKRKPAVLDESSLRKFGSDSENDEPGTSEAAPSLVEVELRVKKKGRAKKNTEMVELPAKREGRAKKTEKKVQGKKGGKKVNGIEETGSDADVEEDSGGEDTDHADSGHEDGEGEGEEKGNAFARAFTRIMEKEIPDELPGPLLADKAKSLARHKAEETAAKEARRAAREKKADLREKGHVVPTVAIDLVERALIKVATKGVVQLFNAVRKVQRGQVSSLPTKKPAADKKSRQAFLAELRGVAASAAEGGAGAGAARANGAQEGRQAAAAGRAPAAEPGWDVLRDDFMLGKARLKDWDKEQESEEEDVNGAGVASDSD